MLVRKKKNVKERHCRSRSNRIKAGHLGKAQALYWFERVLVLFFLYLMLDMTLNDLCSERQLLFSEKQSHVLLHYEAG